MSNPTTTTTDLCYAAATKEGYWTCDEFGCRDCRRLARGLEDWGQIAEWDDERREHERHGTCPHFTLVDQGAVLVCYDCGEVDCLDDPL
jgi:hypothetical protein